MYVQLLQLLQRSEAVAVGGSSCGMSRSLAAGLMRAGRTLVTLGTYLSTKMPHDSSFNPFLAFTPQNILHMRGLLEWLSACSQMSDDEKPPQLEVEPGAQQGPPMSAQASILLQAMQSLASCVRTIKQDLQQRAAAAKAAAAAASSNDSMFSQSSSSGSSRHASSSSSSSNQGVHCADAVQGRDQQHCLALPVLHSSQGYRGG
jgi:hypothetical protein